MRDALAAGAIIAAGLLYILALLWLLRWGTVALVWIKRAIFGAPAQSRWGQTNPEPFRDYQPETAPNAPFWGAAAKPFFTLAALAVVLSLTARLIFEAMGWPWPYR